MKQTVGVRLDDPEALKAGIRRGDRLSLARAITWVENETSQAPALLAALYPHTGKAHIVGITGAPGTGKSTLVTALAQSLRGQGKRVAVVAVDPTSPFTGGAILGDRVRMRTLSGDPGVFIRSMATRGSLGGLSKKTNDVVTVLDAAGFDVILVETVGVGQAEVAIASMAHTTLVVEAPGLGDEIQAIKAGILEIADILVVNKADRPGADKTVQALEMMLALESDRPRTLRHHGQVIRTETQPRPEDARWAVRVLRTVAADGSGVDALVARMAEHYQWLVASGELAAREQLRAAHTIEAIVRAELTRRLLARLPTGALDELVEAVRRRDQDPYSAAQQLLAGLTD